MKQLTELEQLKNKTIRKATKTDVSLCLFLGEDEFIVFQATPTYEYPDLEIADLKNLDNSEQRDLGIISKEECRDRWKAGREEDVKKERERELAQLKRLKAKYEPIKKGGGIKRCQGSSESG